MTELTSQICVELVIISGVVCPRTRFWTRFCVSAQNCLGLRIVVYGSGFVILKRLQRNANANVSNKEDVFEGCSGTGLGVWLPS